jgi:hypothetical protein
MFRMRDGKVDLIQSIVAASMDCPGADPIAAESTKLNTIHLALDREEGCLEKRKPSAISGKLKQTHLHPIC